jgi:hypothetical protein
MPDKKHPLGFWNPLEQGASLILLRREIFINNAVGATSSNFIIIIKRKQDTIIL